jgi:VWFA-related protein
MIRRATRLKGPIAISLLTYVVFPVLGQSGRIRERPKPQDPQNDAFKLRVEEVLLPVRIRNHSGKPPANLERQEVIVVEDGKRQTVNSVMRTPANVLFILDTGGESTLKNLNLHRTLASRLLDLLGPEDQAAILTYGEGVKLVAAWTRDKRELKRALDWKFRPGLMSEFYSSLQYAAEEVLPKVGARRSVVIIGDGIDSFDNHRFEQALTQLHHARATVYVVGQNSILLEEIRPEAYNALSWFERLDPKARQRIERLRTYSRQLEAAEVTLKGLAEETGGAAWYPATQEEFQLLDRQICSEMNTEYIVAYQSQRPPDDTKFHSIRVSLTRSDLQVRCRRGVYSSGPRPQSGKASSGTASVRSQSG